MDLSEFDDTQLDAVWRRQCWRDGNRIKTRLWLDRDGAERDTSENKILRSLYRKKMQDYWVVLDPNKLEQAQRMSKYVKDPVPERAHAISLKKHECRAHGRRQC